MDVLFELSALPNLHPALVHFPFALVAVRLNISTSAAKVRSHRALSRLRIILEDEDV